MPAVKPPNEETEQTGPRSKERDPVDPGGGAGPGCVVALVLFGALLTSVALVVGLIRWLG